MWSILYVQGFPSGSIFSIGPHTSREDAMRVFRKAATGEDAEFDISDQHVYLLTPDHQLQELGESDLTETSTKE